MEKTNVIRGMRREVVLKVACLKNRFIEVKVQFKRFTVTGGEMMIKYQ